MTKKKLLSLFTATALSITMLSSTAYGVHPRHQNGPDGNPLGRYIEGGPDDTSSQTPSKPASPSPADVAYSDNLTDLKQKFRSALEASNAAIAPAKQDADNHEQQRLKHNAQVDVVNELKTPSAIKSYMPTQEWLTDFTKKTSEFVGIYKREFEAKKALFDGHVNLPDDYVHVEVAGVDRSLLMSALRAVPKKNAGVTLHDRFGPSNRAFFGRRFTELMNPLTEKVGEQAVVYARASDKLHKGLNKYLNGRALKLDAGGEGDESFVPQDHSLSSGATHHVVWSFSDGVFLRKNGYVKGTSYIDAIPAPGHLLTWAEHTIVLLRLDYLSSAQKYNLAKTFGVLAQEAKKVLQPVIVGEKDVWLKKTVLEKDKLENEKKLLTKLSGKAKTSLDAYKAKKKKMEDALKTLNDHENKRKMPLTKLVSNTAPREQSTLIASDMSTKKKEKRYVPYNMPTFPKGSPLSGKLFVLAV